MENLLIKGDNEKALQYLLEKGGLRGKIDLVYIDPPFATGGKFTITNGRASTISNSKKRAACLFRHAEREGFYRIFEDAFVVDSRIAFRAGLYLFAY